VQEVEDSPLFRRPFECDHVIRRRRYPNIPLSSGFFASFRRSPRNADGAEESGGVESAPSGGEFEAEPLLAARREVIPLLQRLGAARFKMLFLDAAEGMTAAELAAATGLTPAEVARVNRFVDDYAAASEFYQPSSLAAGRLRYSKVAVIEQGPDGPVVAFTSPRYARGIFDINAEKLDALRAGGALSAAEQRELPQLLRRLELINNRLDTVSRVLLQLLARQQPFFAGGDPRALLPLSQKDLATSLGLPPSNVCRAIAGKSVGTPWGEKPLKDFFPEPKQFRRDLLARVMAGEKGRVNDESLRRRLREKFGVSISRRYVAKLRRELGIPPGRVWNRGVKRGSAPLRKRNTPSLEGKGQGTG